MGLGFVLLLWAVVGTVLAGIGALVLGGLSAFLTRGAAIGRKRLILASSLFPFLCLGWTGAVFLFQAIVNDTVLHRDVGLGDTWYCPLPNGYEITFIDVTDHGWVCNPKTRLSNTTLFEREDCIGGVRQLQVAGRYMLGAADSKAFTKLESGSDNDVDSFFLLDAQTGHRSNYSSLEQLRSAALRLNISSDLQPISVVYAHYRFTWFEVFVGILECTPIILGFVLLARWTVRLKKNRISMIRPV